MRQLFLLFCVCLLVCLCCPTAPFLQRLPSTCRFALCLLSLTVAYHPLLADRCYRNNIAARRIPKEQVASKAPCKPETSHHQQREGKCILSKGAIRKEMFQRCRNLLGMGARILGRKNSKNQLGIWLLNFNYRAMAKRRFLAKSGPSPFCGELQTFNSEF